MDFMPAPLRERFLQEVTNNWARNNFPAINEFLATAPVEQITPEVIKAAARHWSGHQPNKASIEWAANLPEAYRSTAMFEVLDHVYNTPDPVKEALKNITDPVLKEMAIKALGPKAPPQ